MTMTTIPESLNSPASGKAVFMEFGPPSQQMSPSAMSHGHYPMHCLHSAGHTQHDSYSPASSFPRSLGYPYGSHPTSPYLGSVQTYQNSSALTQTRLEDTGKRHISLSDTSHLSCFMETPSQMLGLVIIYCVML